MRIAIALLIAAAFSVIMSLVIQLQAELRLLQEEPVDSLHWNVTQLELDVVRLEAAARLALAQPDSDLADVRRRFDLFYNRAGTVTDGAMFARFGLAETVAPVKDRMRSFLSTTAALVDGPDPALRAALPQIATAVADLRQDFRIMAIQVVEVNAAMRDEQRANLRDILQKTGIASLVLVSLLVGLLALVLGLNRRADRRTREVERITARLEATVATALDGVIVAGLDGRVIDFNAAAEAIFGYRRDEAIGQSLGKLIVPKRDVQAHDAGMARMRATGVKHVVDAGRIQITAMRKSGEEFPVEMSIASSDGPDGMIFVAYLRDISDARKAEAALVAARDKAQAAEQTKTNFIAVMSHEMRTPLNGVIGSLDILGRSDMQPQQKRFLTLARSSAQQLLRHVNDVLDISRVEAGHLKVVTDRLDVPALVATLVDPMRPAAAKKGLDLTVKILNDFPALWGDAFRVGQILQNFVSNAIKFTNSGGITVEVELQRLGETEAEVEFRVIDSGLGIAEGDQDRVFEDFVMVDPSHGRSVGGTGLGLAISRRVARAMGGEVGVESELGEGSCFWLRLPLALDKADTGRADRRNQPVMPAAPAQIVPPPKPSAAKSTKAKATPKAPEKGQDSGLKILIVEDNEANRIVLEEMLHHLGHRVDMANDGGEGVEKARATRFDLILMDLSMPLMDGWTAASAIRLGGASEHSRILAVTAHAKPDRIDRMIESGFDGWLTKPLSIDSLSAALAEVPSPNAPAKAAMKPNPAPCKHPDDLPQDDRLGRFEPSRLAELRKVMEPKALSRLMASFETQMDALLHLVQSPEATADLPQMAKEVHAGVGAAAILGVEPLRNCLANLETACNQADHDGIRHGRDQLAQIWPQVKATLAAPG